MACLPGMLPAFPVTAPTDQDIQETLLECFRLYDQTVQSQFDQIWRYILKPDPGAARKDLETNDPVFVPVPHNSTLDSLQLKIMELNEIIAKHKKTTEVDDGAKQKLDQLSKLVGSVNSSTPTEASAAWFFSHTFQHFNNANLKHAVGDMCALSFALHLNDVYDKKTFKYKVIKFVESKFSTTGESLREAFVERICHARWQVLERHAGFVDRRRRVRPCPHSSSR